MAFSTLISPMAKLVRGFLVSKKSSEWYNNRKTTLLHDKSPLFCGSGYSGRAMRAPTRNGIILRSPARYAIVFRRITVCNIEKRALSDWIRLCFRICFYVSLSVCSVFELSEGESAAIIFRSSVMPTSELINSLDQVPFRSQAKVPTRPFPYCH